MFKAPQRFFSGRIIATSLSVNKSFTQSSRPFMTYTPSHPVALSVSSKPVQFFSARSGTSSINSEEFNCEEVLDEFSDRLGFKGEQPFKDVNVMLVAMQHALGTTVDMFKVLKKLGLKHAIIGGKSYSTHIDSSKELEKLEYTFVGAPDQLGFGHYEACIQETVNNMWNKSTELLMELNSKGERVDLLIAMDDGGNLIRAIPAKYLNGIPYKPKRIVGIEQTRGGSNNPYFKSVPFPTINVAGSYVKTAIEYPSVAKLAAAKVIQAVELKIGSEFRHKPIIGVVGYGTMGKAVAKCFIDKGYRVLVHDHLLHKNAEVRRNNWRATIATLISDANVIIGCTGKDITLDENVLDTILSSLSTKIYASVSSKDTEFKSLLLRIQEETKQHETTPNPFADIEYMNLEEDSAKISILNGGFPVNFDRKEHSVDPKDIWPTRAALLGACLMGVRAYEQQVLDTTCVLKLDAAIQDLIIQMYGKRNPHNPVIQQIKELPDPDLLDLIDNNSDGTALPVFEDPGSTLRCGM